MTTVLIFWSLTTAFGVIAVLLAKKTATPYLVVVLIASLLISLFADSIGRRRRCRNGMENGKSSQH